VLVLRKTQPERPRSFRVPLAGATATLSVLACLVLMLSLTLENWIRFVVWLVIGLVIYFMYSRKRSALSAEAEAKL
jgi:APA family basic amino acid/polyamine antiporter